MFVGGKKHRSNVDFFAISVPYDSADNTTTVPGTGQQNIYILLVLYLCTKESYLFRPRFGIFFNRHLSIKTYAYILVYTLRRALEVHSTVMN